jgi:hypothetical protein
MDVSVYPWRARGSNRRNVNEPLQLWGFRNMPGNRVQMQNLQMGCVDASAGAFGILRAQQRSPTSLAQQFTME